MTPAGLLCLVLRLYLIVLFARIIMSWIPVSPESPFASLAAVLHRLTEPVLGPIRRALPPVRLGGMGLDLSPIIVLFGIQIITGFICS